MGEVIDLFNKKKVSAKCMSCGDVHTRIVDGDAWNWYINSKRLVQDLFPDEDTWTREILIAARLDAWLKRGRCSLYMCKKCCDEWEE